MPAAIIGSVVTAGTAAYNAYNENAANNASVEPNVVALTPQEDAFFEKSAINAQNASQAQTNAYLTNATAQTAASTFVKWGLAIAVIWFLWRVATKKHLV